MLAPTSPLVAGLLLLAASGLLVGVVRWRHWAIKTIAAVAALGLGVTTGVVAVNDYFGYYTTWSDAYAGTLGSSPPRTALDTRQPAGSGQQVQGRLLSLEMGGAHSHIKRRGYIYLPPQYNEKRYRSVRFPVVELLHGTPGGPWNWRDQLHIATTIDSMLASRAIGPMVFVIPNVSVGPAQECLDHGAVLDNTYVSRDVPADIRRHFRVSRDPSQWALFGYSSGGYCAANLALQHRRDFGAVASMDGYYWPADGPAGRILAGDAAATALNDPLATVNALPTTAVPLPQFWISTGSGDKGDLSGAQQFVSALQRLEGVTLVVQRNARHNFYTWNDETPRALAWLWSAIAPPSLRVEFPTAGSAHGITVAADPRASKRAHSRPVTRPPATKPPAHKRSVAQRKAKRKA